VASIISCEAQLTNFVTIMHVLNETLVFVMNQGGHVQHKTIASQGDSLCGNCKSKIANCEFGELFSDEQHWLLNRKAISARIVSG
jgi:hypothetical protein